MEGPDSFRMVKLKVVIQGMNLIFPWDHARYKMCNYAYEQSEVWRGIKGKVLQIVPGK